MAFFASKEKETMNNPLINGKSLLHKRSLIYYLWKAILASFNEIMELLQMPDANTTKNSESIGISAGAAKQIANLIEKEDKVGMRLRVAVSGGGCSGFQYGFSLDSITNADDHLFTKDSIEVVVDEVSLEYLNGSELDYVQDLIGSYFSMKNPNASSTCGCGTSFAV